MKPPTFSSDRPPTLSVPGTPPSPPIADRNQATRTAAILHQRAALLARRHIDRRTTTRTAKILVVRTAGERLGLPASALAEVLPPQCVTPVPGSPAALRGVINVRGEVRPLLSLAMVLGLGAGANTAGGHVLILAHGNRRIGFEVDEVERFVDVAAEDLDPATLSNVAGRQPWVRSITADGTACIDMQELLQHQILNGGGPMQTAPADQESPHELI
jgi:chemotaxis signal transduction protein